MGSKRRGERKRKLRRDPRLVEFERSERRRRAREQALNDDAAFLQCREKLQQELQTAYRYHPAAIEEFFKLYHLPSPFTLRRSREFIETFRGDDIRKVLTDYLQFANRFRVCFNFVKKPAHFELRVFPPYGWKFHVKQVKGQLRAMGPVSPEDPDLSEVDYFEASDLEVPRAAGELIKQRLAKFVQIDDESGFSALNDLENFAYFENGITFVLHRADQPYLLCLFGEAVKKETLHAAGKIVSAFQREYYGRKAGRPPDVGRMKKTFEQLRKPGPMKEKAYAVQTTDKLSSSQAYISRRRNKLRQNS